MAGFRSERPPYARLSFRQRTILNSLPRPSIGRFRPWAVSAIGHDGRNYPNVLVGNADDFFAIWGVWPRDDRGKSEIDIRSVEDFHPSPNAMPVACLNKQVISEIGMGGNGFALEFEDGRILDCTTSNVSEFLKLPEGYSVEKITNIHRSRIRGGTYVGAEFLWCLYDGDPH